MTRDRNNKNTGPPTLTPAIKVNIEKWKSGTERRTLWLSVTGIYKPKLVGFLGNRNLGGSTKPMKCGNGVHPSLGGRWGIHFKY